MGGRLLRSYSPNALEHVSRQHTHGPQLDEQVNLGFAIEGPSAAFLDGKSLLMSYLPLNLHSPPKADGPIPFSPFIEIGARHLHLSMTPNVLSPNESLEPNGDGLL